MGIFLIFWKPHCCTKFLSIKLETSNFGYLPLLEVSKKNFGATMWFPEDLEKLL
jgi:hypothetical protein